MSIDSERLALLKRLKKDSKEDVKKYSQRMKMSYQTILTIVRGRSLGTIRTWQRIEKFYAKIDKVS